MYFMCPFAGNVLYVYEMTHTGPPKRVVFVHDLVEISDISNGNIIIKGVANHASKVFQYWKYLSFSG